MARIRIDVSEQMGGCNFSLDPRSEIRVRQDLTGRHTVPHVFVSYDSVTGHFTDIPEAILAQIVRMLTGVPPSRLSKFGGYVFVDPASKKVIRDPQKQHV